jgi:fumarate hydratase class II
MSEFRIETDSLGEVKVPADDLTLKDAALELGFVTEEEFDRVVDPAKMLQPYVVTGN